MMTTIRNKGGRIPIKAVCLAALVIMVIVVPASAALIWGPYLTGTTTTGTIVNAKTGVPTMLTIEYASDDYYQESGTYDLSATDGISSELHHVPLTGLTPDTIYHYRVVYDSQPTGDFHISTFAESGPFTFIVYSDTQDQLPTFSQLERHKLVADRIAGEPDVAFVLNSGDLVNNAADLADWDRYFAAGSMMMANITVYPTLGNHDANNTNYYAAYGVPEYYSFDCADSHITVLDSNAWAWSDLPVQSSWLAADLQTEKSFKFVSFHHPIYTSESKHFGGWENLREAWESILNENSVLAVFNGHVHAYERFLVNNTTYFVEGIGGGPSYTLATPRAAGSQNSLENIIGYTRVTVDPSTRTATADVIRVADVSSDLKSLTEIYPPETIVETVVMHLQETPEAVPALAVTVSSFPVALPKTGEVTYTYLVKNTGTTPLSSLVLTDDQFGEIFGPSSGDLNSNGVLETDETWDYTHTAILSLTTTNIATGTGLDPTGSRVSVQSNELTVQVGGMPAPEFPSTAALILFIGTIGVVTALLKKRS